MSKEIRTFSEKVALCKELKRQIQNLKRSAQGDRLPEWLPEEVQNHIQDSYYAKWEWLDEKDGPILVLFREGGASEEQESDLHELAQDLGLGVFEDESGSGLVLDGEKSKESEKDKDKEEEVKSSNKKASPVVSLGDIPNLAYEIARESLNPELEFKNRPAFEYARSLANKRLTEGADPEELRRYFINEIGHDSNFIGLIRSSRKREQEMIKSLKEASIEDLKAEVLRRKAELPSRLDVHKHKRADWEHIGLSVNAIFDEVRGTLEEAWTQAFNDLEDLAVENGFSDSEDMAQKSPDSGVESLIYGILDQRLDW